MRELKKRPRPTKGCRAIEEEYWRRPADRLSKERFSTYTFPKENSTQKDLRANERANLNAGPLNEIQAHSH
jgi:hypothetical protein